MSDPHDKQLASAFLEQELCVGPLKLRPLAPVALSILQDMENPFFTEGEEIEGESSGELDSKTISALTEYIFAHSAGVDEVLNAAQKKEYFRRAAQKHCFDITMVEFISFLKTMERIQNAAAAAIVEPIEEDDAEPGKNQQSLTGSPASSSISEPQEIQTRNATSAGTCPSHAPSSIFTQPTEPTAPAAASSTGVEVVTRLEPPSNA